MAHRYVDAAVFVCVFAVRLPIRTKPRVYIFRVRFAKEVPAVFVSICKTGGELAI